MSDEIVHTLSFRLRGPSRTQLWSVSFRGLWHIPRPACSLCSAAISLHLRSGQVLHLISQTAAILRQRRDCTTGGGYAIILYEPGLLPRISTHLGTVLEHLSRIYQCIFEETTRYESQELNCHSQQDRRFRSTLAYGTTYSITAFRPGAARLFVLAIQRNVLYP